MREGGTGEEKKVQTYAVRHFWEGKGRAALKAMPMAGCKR